MHAVLVAGRVLGRGLLLGGQRVGERADEPERRAQRLVDGRGLRPRPVLLREEVGHADPVIDRRRHYVEPSGIVVVPRGGRREFLLGLEEF